MRQDISPEIAETNILSYWKVKEDGEAFLTGVNGAGKGDVINQLNEWLDPRYVRTHAFAAPSEEERERPKYWRCWMSLLPKGLIGIYVGFWYSSPFGQRVNGDLNTAEFERQLAEINAFEETLSQDS